ncbi:Nn.00g033710.m01.CDS01 [Neocucurbitaria sp. VM-36]
MSTRRSGRAKAPVKYTSDSEGSDFGAKKRKAPTSKKTSQATPKKAPKREAAETEATAPTTTTAPTPKRRKKDPETLAAEYAGKAKAQEEKAQKAQYKKGWEDWQKQHDAGGKLLDAEPERDESITQTDSLKKYSLKPGELGSLFHFEKRHPTYGNTTKLFREEDVRQVAFRKYGILAGETDDEATLLKKGEELWKEEHASPFSSSIADDEDTKVKVVASKSDKPPKKDKTPKQKWAEYIATHALAATGKDNDKLAEEPEESVNQTESKSTYNLTPQDLACLPYFSKKNPKYGGTIKLFKVSEVKGLAWRKAAVLAGVEENGGGEVNFLERGKEIFEGKK